MTIHTGSPTRFGARESVRAVMITEAEPRWGTPVISAGPRSGFQANPCAMRSPLKDRRPATPENTNLTEHGGGRRAAEPSAGGLEQPHIDRSAPPKMVCLSRIG